ncbi:MAG: hypothetical protein ISS63_07355 [Desulfobacteraceae bacterium]|nr:hypothetical protein [Desulfobacteraceae bacterium]
MKNSFLDFRSIPYRKKDIPLQRIARAKQEVIDHIVEKYICLVEEGVKDLVSLIDHSHVDRAYSAAVKSIRDLQFDPEDIEDFCAELDSSIKSPYMISEPVGIYVSALVNHAKEDRIVLPLWNSQRTFNFLGYRLPEGKTLLIQGDVGDFIGACLSGGRLVVEGSTGNCCGAGMVKGEILVTENTGQNTGEWMQGGEIRVDGRVRGIGKNFLGGRIYKQRKLLAPGIQ